MEERQPVNLETHHPACTGGDGTCPQEDCSGPEGWMWRQDNASGYEMIGALETATELLQEISEAKSFVALDDPDHAEELRDALKRIEERASWLGQPFERRKVSERLRQGEHLANHEPSGIDFRLIQFRRDIAPIISSLRISA